MEPCAAAPFAYGVFLSQLLFWLAGLLSQSRPVGFANFPKGDGKPSQALPRQLSQGESGHARKLYGSAGNCTATA